MKLLKYRLVVLALFEYRLFTTLSGHPSPRLFRRDSVAHPVDLLRHYLGGTNVEVQGIEQINLSLG